MSEGCFEAYWARFGVSGRHFSHLGLTFRFLEFNFGGRGSLLDPGGALWGFLGPRTPENEKKTKVPTVFGEILVGFWGGLGGLLGYLGVQDRAKTPTKSMPTSIENLMPLGIGILSDLIGILGGKWKQVGTKNRSKTYFE